MCTGITDECRKDAVRIALSSKDQKTVRRTVFPEDGLSRQQVPDDLSVGKSTLNTWVTAHRDEYRSDAAAHAAIASKLGCSPDSLREWGRQAQRAGTDQCREGSNQRA